MSLQAAEQLVRDSVGVDDELAAEVDQGLRALVEHEMFGVLAPLDDRAPHEQRTELAAVGARDRAAEQNGFALAEKRPRLVEQVVPFEHRAQRDARMNERRLHVRDVAMGGGQMLRQVGP